MLTRKLKFYIVKKILTIIITVFNKCIDSNIVKTQCTVLFNTDQHQFQRV